jgi:hypothetical protein
MAAQEKNLTKSSIRNETLERITNLSKEILDGVSTSVELNKTLALAKKSLSDVCTQIFLKDLDKGEIYGNYVVEVGDRKLTVNLRMGPQANISEYEKTLRADFKDNYADLFIEVPTIEVTTAYPNQKVQFDNHPELFSLCLKTSITMAEMKKVFKRFPECFELTIRDKVRYAEVYPSSVETKKKIYPVNGILEKLANLEQELRARIIRVLSKFFQKNLECAVKA